MILDNQQIVIRERSYLELLDLSLRVLRTYAAPLCVALLAGIGPAFVLNAWLLNGLAWGSTSSGPPGWYLFWMIVFVIWELPLATAPATIFLGQALFHQRPNARQVVRQFVASLPQLLWYQSFLRIITLPLMLPFFSFPYLTEVIVLERNPMSSKRGRAITTWRRSAALHRDQGGELFFRWMGNLEVGFILVAVFWISLSVMAGLLLDEWSWDGPFYTLFFPASLWISAAYFTVLRFLGYLDLRIRREGWEVELLMRAERSRFVRAWE